MSEKTHRNTDNGGPADFMTAFIQTASEADVGILMVQEENGREAIITYANAVIFRMSNCSEDEILHRSIYEFLGPESHEKARKNYEDILGEHAPFLRMEYDVIVKNGSILPTEITTGKTVYDGKPAVLLFILDISRKKSFEKELLETKEKAEAATVAKSQFLANMSHEIRTPLNGVIGILEMLLDTEMNPAQKDLARSAKKSADCLLSIVNDILDFSKIEAGKLEFESIEFDLRITLEDLSEIMALRAVGKEIEVSCLIHNDVPSFLIGDPGRLRQVLLNLSGNAIKFVEKGDVSLIVSMKMETEDYVTLLFEVIDTGIGIPEDRKDLLFQTFSQVDTSTTRKFGGTGLGLAISKQLVELMHGDIGVESKYGEGSNFWFTAQFLKQPSEKDDENGEIFEDIKGCPVLVVDGNPRTRRIFAEYLSSLNIPFGQAEHGVETLVKMKSAVKEGEPYRVAIIDLILPGIDGEKLGKLIKNDPVLSDTALILTTSIGSRGDAERFRNMGFSAYLSRPVRRSHLYDCILAVLNKKRDEKRIITKYSLDEKRLERKKMTQGLNIMLVEDNPVNQKVMTLILNKFNHTVTVAQNGKEAVAIYQGYIASLKQKGDIPPEKRDRFDIIFMDIQMPVMDGMEATKQIRGLEQEHQNDGCPQIQVPIVAVTANAMKGDRERFLDAGMTEYISKPVRREVVIDVIEKCVSLDSRP